MKLCIIGGGPAGYNGAIRGHELGFDVTLIEKQQLGGTCLNRGCIPTKCLLRSAELYADMLNAEEFGISTQNTIFNQESVYQRKQEIVTKLNAGIEFLMKSNKVKVIKGDARFLDKNTLKASTENGDVIVEADYFLVATGSSPIRLPIKGIEYTLNSDDVLNMPVEGNSVIILGGGVIGMEFASYYADIGKKVTVVELEKRVLPLLDKDFSNYLTMLLKKKGVNLMTSTTAEQIIKNESGYSVIVKQQESTLTLESDNVIVSIGRRANVTQLGLEDIGVCFKGRIEVDESFKTSVDNIYAAGDCASKIQLAHLAEAEAVTAVENMAGISNTQDLSVIPSAVYTSPEIASVGITTFEKGEGYTAGKAMMGANGKALIEGNSTGFVKLVVDSNGILVGGAIMCPRATDMIAELALAIRNKLNIRQLVATIHPHPTLSEAIKQAANSLKI